MRLGASERAPNHPIPEIRHDITRVRHQTNLTSERGAGQIHACDDPASAEVNTSTSDFPAATQPGELGASAP